MRVFRVQSPAALRVAMPYELDGRHKWQLPGVKCDACGSTWASYGVAYPTVDLPHGLEYDFYSPVEALERGHTPVSPERLEELRRPLRHLFPDEEPMSPGLRFGQFVGAARGAVSSLSWCGRSSLFIAPATYDALSKTGVRGLTSREADIIYRGRKSTDFLELQIVSHATFVRLPLRDEASRPCQSCGWHPMKAPEQVVLEQSSLPQDVDLFRAWQMRGWVFATERFVDAVRSLRLEGCILTQVGTG